MSIVHKRILIQKINHLPTLPSVITKIIELTESRNANAKDLADILSKDPSIASTILKLVNSAFYGNLRHISSIQHAAVILGFQMIKTIAMGVSIFETRGGSAQPFDRGQFWVHSIGTASLAKMLADRINAPSDLDREMVFLSGLLHDVGKVIFDNYFEEDYAKVAEILETEDVWIGKVEEQVMGINHCEAGFYLARKWQFPMPVVEAIRFHHNLEKCSEKNLLLCALVNAADHGCRRIKLGFSGDWTIPPLDPCLERLGITPSIMDAALEDLERMRESFESFVQE